MAEPETICELTELPTWACHHCRRRAVNGRFIDALFPGHCATCDQPITVGQRIKEKEDGTYEHAGHRS